MERALSAILLIVKARPLCGATGPMGRRGHQSPCEPDGLEVEFLTASGGTAAVLTLNVRDVRPAADDDLVSVRTRRRSA